jgi:antitoxin (DNA-binding transcriptional repressor) of toxin-antitoxin stability system
MAIVNMLKAKSSLSRLVEAVESGAKREIIIARNGKAAAKLVPVDGAPTGRRIGVAKGKFRFPGSIDRPNSRIARLFSGSKG